MFNSKDARRMDRILKKTICAREKIIGFPIKILISIIKTSLFIIIAIIFSIFTFVFGSFIKKKEYETRINNIRKYR